MDYRTLITVDELAAILSTQQVVLVDCRFSLADTTAGESEYLAGHLPGAVYAHLDRDLSSPITSTSGRHPLPDADHLVARFAAWGIDHTKQLVAYDNSGGAFASRFWWLARWLGITKVAVLDGGFAAWQAAGLPVSTDVPHPTPTQFTAAPDDRLWMSADEVDKGLAAGEITLVDAREPERFRGEVEPIDPVAGHVPGATNVPFKGHLTATGHYRVASELRERFAVVAASPDTAVYMCGSGVTACVNLLAAEHAGLAGGRLYAGSWSEWIRDPERPVATGE